MARARISLSRYRPLADRIDAAISGTMARFGVTAMRIAIGVVYTWFGALKLIPGASPAEPLVIQTVPFVPPEILLPSLGLWELAIGILFLTGRGLRLAIALLFLQMPGTMMPMVLLPGQVWRDFPFVLTLEGQYIVKNLLIVSGALVVGATVRGDQREDGKPPA